MIETGKLIEQAARNRGWKVFIVGGFVRDSILGKESKDLDVEICGPTEEELERFLSQFGEVNAEGKSFVAFKLRIDGVDLDVSLPRTESKTGKGHKGFVVQPDSMLTPKEASVRRDFTFNAMMMTLPQCEILDFFGGQEHLKAKRLIHTSSAFADDPLRVMRGMQFCGRFDLTAEQETVNLCKELLPEFETLATERLWIEWEKWAAKSTNPSRGLVFLLRTGWVAKFPEIAGIIGVKQGGKHHPEGSVWQHTKLVVDQAARIAKREGLSREDTVVLVLSALCHDLGKAVVSIVQSEEIVNSNGHAAASEILARSFLESIGAPKEIVKKVCVLVKEHMNKASTQRAVRRLASRLDCVSVRMIALLIEADSNGRGGNHSGIPQSAETILRIAQELNVQNSKPQPILLGRHLLEIGMRPGAKFGVILRAAFEQQLNGTFNTLEEARQWLVLFLN